MASSSTSENPPQEDQGGGGFNTTNPPSLEMVPFNAPDASSTSPGAGAVSPTNSLSSIDPAELDAALSMINLNLNLNLAGSSQQQQQQLSSAQQRLARARLARERRSEGEILKRGRVVADVHSIIEIENRNNNNDNDNDNDNGGDDDGNSNNNDSSKKDNENENDISVLLEAQARAAFAQNLKVFRPFVVQTQTEESEGEKEEPSLLAMDVDEESKKAEKDAEGEGSGPKESDDDDDDDDEDEEEEEEEEQEKIDVDNVVDPEWDRELITHYHTSNPRTRQILTFIHNTRYREVMRLRNAYLKESRKVAKQKRKEERERKRAEEKKRKEEEEEAAKMRDFVPALVVTEAGVFDLLASLCNSANMIIEVCKHLRPIDILTLYRTSRVVHDTVKTYMRSSVIAWARHMAPSSARIFHYRLYGGYTVEDPVGRPADAAYHDMHHLSIPGGQPTGAVADMDMATTTATAAETTKKDVRRIPGLAWLDLVVRREKQVRDILATLARMGFRTLPGTHRTLKKLWVVMDTATNEYRLSIMRDEAFFSNCDLYRAQLFFVKLLLCFNDPHYGRGSDALFNVVLGQRDGWESLWALLRRRRFTSEQEVVQAALRYNVEPRDEEMFLGEPVLGVEVDDMGLGHLEGWGDGSVHLMRPDELVVVEAARRQFPLPDGIDEMILYGHMDLNRRGRHLVPTLDEMYMSDDDQAPEPAAVARSIFGGCGNVPFEGDMWQPIDAHREMLMEMVERDHQAAMAAKAVEEEDFRREMDALPWEEVDFSAVDLDAEEDWERELKRIRAAQNQTAVLENSGDNNNGSNAAATVDAAAGPVGDITNYNDVQQTALEHDNAAAAGDAPQSPSGNTTDSDEALLELGEDYVRLRDIKFNWNEHIMRSRGLADGIVRGGSDVSDSDSEEDDSDEEDEDEDEDEDEEDEEDYEEEEDEDEEGTIEAFLRGQMNEDGDGDVAMGDAANPFTTNQNMHVMQGMQQPQYYTGMQQHAAIQPAAFMQQAAIQPTSTFTQYAGMQQAAVQPTLMQQAAAMQPTTFTFTQHVPAQLPFMHHQAAMQLTTTNPLFTHQPATQQQHVVTQPTVFTQQAVMQSTGVQQQHQHQQAAMQQHAGGAVVEAHGAVGAANYAANDKEDADEADKEADEADEDDDDEDDDAETFVEKQTDSKDEKSDAELTFEEARAKAWGEDLMSILERLL